MQKLHAKRLFFSSYITLIAKEKPKGDDTDDQIINDPEGAQNKDYLVLLYKISALKRTSMESIG